MARPAGIHDNINELTLRNKLMINKLLHIMTMKERLFVGGLVHEHMCETAFLAVIHGKQMCGLSSIHVTRPAGTHGSRS